MMNDKILIKGLKINASIGCLAWEKCQTQAIELHVQYETDCRQAAETDDICQAVSYAEVVSLIKQITAEKHYHLVEHLAHTICEDILAKFPIDSITVEVIKPHILQDTAGVGIQMTRRRNHAS